MDSHYYNTRMPQANHIWAGHIFSMDVMPLKFAGPDLMGRRKNIEVKTGIEEGNWTLAARQLEYEATYEKPCFILLMKYEMLLPVEKVNTPDIRKLGALVTYREMWVADWEWVKSLPVPRNPAYRYPRTESLPQITASRKLKRAEVHFTGGIRPERFGL